MRTTGELETLRRGVYVERPVPSEEETDRRKDYERKRDQLLELTVAASRVVERGTVFSHASALAAHGLPLHDQRTDIATATRYRAKGGTYSSPLLTCYNSDLTGAVCVVDGLPVTTVARTLVDVALRGTLVGGVCAADEALRSGMCSRAELDAAVVAAKGRTGIGKARAMADAATPLAESVLESISRVELACAGIPEPQLQVPFTLRDHTRVRVDMFWEAWGLVGECDGVGKYGSDDSAVQVSLREERRRQSGLEQLGLTVVRWGWSDAVHPYELQRLVRSALLRQEHLGFGP